MTARLWLITLCFVVTAGYNVWAMRPEAVPPRQPLEALPKTLGRWTGFDDQPMDEKIVSVLGVDEYLSRTYRDRGGPEVALYVGYYRSQRQGDTIHSPLNCLPGAGWQPVSLTRRQIEVPGRSTPIDVNVVLIRKGLEQGAVIYWYQSQGRAVASEYWSKLFMIYDSVRRHRSDGAIIRVLTPVLSTDTQGRDAEARAIDFVRALFPQIDGHLPS